MKTIIGRKREINLLDNIYKKTGPQLVILYGRRRVGKTYLINELYENEFVFKVTGINSKEKELQLQCFSLELLNRNCVLTNTIDNWFTAFDFLKKYLSSLNESKKHIVFFDEMPWMDTPRSQFKEAFEYFWNNYGCTNKNLIFIVCGSSSSWIMNNLINNKGGLFNRHTARIFLEPFNLNETEEFLKSRNINWSRYDISECYMALGGIPYYLNLLDSGQTLNENIDNLFFKKHSLLFNEYEKLYNTLFTNYELYKKIVEALNTKKGLSKKEISLKTKVPDNGVLTNVLEDLYYSGFISVSTELGNRKTKIYKLVDFFTIFYLNFIKNKIGVDENYFKNSYNDNSRISWMGLAFERLCFSHIGQIKNALGISGVLTTEYSFNYVPSSTDDDGAQIDMVIERKDKIIDLIEIKFSINEFKIDKAYDMNLRNKIDVFMNHITNKRTIQVVFITTYGVKNNEYSNIVNKSITLDDLFDN